jgi:hypothetical protein
MIAAGRRWRRRQRIFLHTVKHVSKVVISKVGAKVIRQGEFRLGRDCGAGIATRRHGSIPVRAVGSRRVEWSAIHI